MQCFVPFCMNSIDRGSTYVGITFHTFPATSRLRDTWLRALGVQASLLPPGAVICSQHFQSEDFIQTRRGLKKLRPGAIPFVIHDMSTSHSTLNHMDVDNQAEKEIVHRVTDVEIKTEITDESMSEDGPMLANNDSKTFRNVYDLYFDVHKHELCNTIPKVEHLRDKQDGLAPARLANSDNEIEQNDTIEKCEQLFEIDEEHNKSRCNINETKDERRINTASNVCDETTCDAPRKLEQAALEQDKPLTITRTIVYFSDSDTNNNDTDSEDFDYQTTSPDELFTSEIIKPITTHTTIGTVPLNNVGDVGNIATTINAICSYSETHIEGTKIHQIPKLPIKVYQNKSKRENDSVKNIESHTENKPFTCVICQYKCKYNDHLVKHMRTHTGEKPFTCKLCNYKSARNWNLMTHMKTHTGEKAFVCKLCKSKFMFNSYLVSHMRTHTGERPFVCKLCNSKFAGNSSLMAHMRTHTGEKPFACNMCNYKCAYRSSLLSHMRTHTGEKQFACKMCNYKCVHRSSLVNHMRKHTGENASPVKRAARSSKSRGGVAAEASERL